MPEYGTDRLRLGGRTRGRRAAPVPVPARGVTLVELLVSLAIFSIVTAFLFTAFSTTTNSVEHVRELHVHQICP